MIFLQCIKNKEVKFSVEQKKLKEVSNVRSNEQYFKPDKSIS